MKTAISIPDSLYKKVEKTVKMMKVSRSKLFTLALQEYIENHDTPQIIEKLNSVYGTETNSLDDKISAMQIQSLNKEDWQ